MTRDFHRTRLSLLAIAVFSAPVALAASLEDSSVNCYMPTASGWRIHIVDGAAPACPEHSGGIGLVDTARENPRFHRRPLYPPADKSLIWNEAERDKIARFGFRPLVLAYNEPRFLFDYHSAGGLLGHLFAGLVPRGESGKWFHQWSDITVDYTEGRMQYTLNDPAFPGVNVHVEAIALANSIGLLVKVDVEGLDAPAQLVWAYGGASAFFTNYAMTAPQFTFTPEQCAKDRFAWDGKGFVLRRAFDKSDSIMEQPFAAVRTLPDWQAAIHAGSHWQGGGVSGVRQGFGDSTACVSSPGALLNATEWTTSNAERTGRVAVECAELSPSHAEGFIAVGMGGRIESAIRNPGKAYKAALDRNREIASRVVIRTPDPYLNAAAVMIAFATDGLWGDSTVMHGGWSWRFGYLGWRGWYGPNCYGWTDRIRRAIKNYTTLGIIREGKDAGALTSLLDSPGGVFYNMNEVFLDHVRQYFEYTNDIDLMREIWPVLNSIVEWENRRLRPAGGSLYENALNTWISDSHWYIQGQCTQASAYMHGAYTFLADLAPRLGMDPAPYREEAERIRRAMSDTLWMPREGVFAEYLDTRGQKLLHTQPELPSLYHPAEFGLGNVDQMLRWAEHNLRVESTPGGGKLFWSSNWFPNNGRSYTHSTYEIAYAEELNFALTHYLAGRSDDAYALLRATLCGVFNGPTPGGLSCHAYVDGRQRANDEFADAISMWGRTVVEGLFGIKPKLPDGVIELCPQFPIAWPEAEISTKHFSYKWKRVENGIRIDWKAPQPVRVRLKHPTMARRAELLAIDGRRTTYNTTTTGIGVTLCHVETALRDHGTIMMKFSPESIAAPVPREVRPGETVNISIPGHLITECKDPQGLLDGIEIANGSVTATVKGDPGPGVVNVLVGGWPEYDVWPRRLPVPLKIVPTEGAPTRKVWSPPATNQHDLDQWRLVDLREIFNSTILDSLEAVQKRATPPPEGASTVGFDYWKSHLGARHHGDPVQVPSDAAWRAKVGPDGVAWATDGIPFKTNKDGNNIAIVTQTGAFPTKAEFPVGAAGKTLYLMLSGMSFPAQSHMPHLRVTLCYADGQQDQTELTSPETIGDCWSTWCGRWHDTAANGFENLGGRFGPAGSAEAGDLTKPINVDTEAHLLAFDLRPGQTLQSVQIEAIANDIVFGIMGATIGK